MSLYRKHRPQSFSEIIGQGHVSETLLKQLQSGKISHAYLFSGPRGTGKTSTARIFAKSLNCKNFKDDKYGEPCNTCENCTAITEGRYLDVIEIDAASNRGIDEIRDLREKINLAPLSGKFKVYIIDEAHQLTGEAFNALLKTLEEPPAHAVFILATTEPHKIPATILSRVQKYEFGKAARTSIVEKLQRIVKKEDAKISDEGLSLISQLAEGSYRDAEVLLDKILSVNPKATTAEIEKILNLTASDSGFEYLGLILRKETKQAFQWLEDQKPSNYKLFTETYFVEPLRDILLIRVGVLTQSSESKYTPEVFEELSTISKQIPNERLTSLIKIFTEAVSEIKDSPIPSLPLELAIVEACDFLTQIVETVTEEEVKIPEPNVVEEEKIEPEMPIADLPADRQELKEEKKAKKIKTGDLTVTEIQKNWPEVLKKVKPHNNSLEIFLRGAIPTEIEDDLITLEVGYRFHKDRLEEPKNNEIIATVLSEVLGRPVRIKGKVGERVVREKKEPEAPIEEVDPVEIFGKLV